MNVHPVQEHLVLLVALMLGPVFVLAFNRPKMLVQWGGVPRAEVRRRLLSAGAISVGWVLGIQLIVLSESMLLPVAMNGLMVAVLLPAARRVRGDRCAAASPELVPIWPLHRIYSVVPAQEMLRSGRHPELRESLRFRTLTQFFRTVHPGHAARSCNGCDEGGELLRGHFMPEGA